MSTLEQNGSDKADSHVFDKGKGLLEGNDCFANTMAGPVNVSVTTAAQLLLKGDHVHSCIKCGVQVNIDNSLKRGVQVNVDNELAAITIETGGNTTLKTNCILDGKDSGMYLQEEVMVFVNDIAQVVHTQVVQNKGSPNKSIGEAFLLVCKVHRLLSFQDSSVSSYPPLFLPSAVCPPQLTFPAGF